MAMPAELGTLELHPNGAHSGSMQIRPDTASTPADMERGQGSKLTCNRRMTTSMGIIQLITVTAPAPAPSSCSGASLRTRTHMDLECEQPPHEAHARMQSSLEDSAWLAGHMSSSRAGTTSAT